MCEEMNTPTNLWMYKSLKFGENMLLYVFLNSYTLFITQDYCGSKGEKLIQIRRTPKENFLACEIKSHGFQVQLDSGPQNLSLTLVFISIFYVDSIPRLLQQLWYLHFGSVIMYAEEYQYLVPEVSVKTSQDLIKQFPCPYFSYPL